MTHWQPGASGQTLRTRAAWLARMRAFFAARDVLEVETPLLSAAANPDPQLESMAVATAFGPRWLHTSPEFAMKRLLAAGSGPIYQYCRVFRDGEVGRRHNPEFSLLEWYRPGYDLDALMTEVADLVMALTQQRLSVEKLAYRQAFLQYAELDPFTSTVAELQNRLRAGGVALPEALSPAEANDRDLWLDLLMSTVVETHLGRDGLCFVQDYPASQAALARIRHGSKPPVAERFELYWHGMELANGYHELSDVQEQRRRFTRDNERRRQRGRPELPLDQHLLAALTSGLPDSSGVALGFDRLLLCYLGDSALESVVGFSWGKA